MSPVKMIIIVGCARSGTSMTAEMLNKHSHIYISPETKYFQKIYSGRHFKLLLGKEKFLKKAYNTLLDSEYSSSGRKELGKIDYRTWKKCMEENDYFDAFRILLTLLTEKPITGEKTPFHVFFARDLLDRYKDVKVIALHRDVLPNIASMYQRSGFRNVASIEACLARYLIINRHINFLRKYYGDRVLVQEFEELVENTKETMTKLSVFLNINLEEATLKPKGQDSSFGESKTDSNLIDKEVNKRYGYKLSNKDITFLERYETYSLLSNFSRYPLRYLKLFKEIIKIKVAIFLMRAGYYPFALDAK